MPLTKPYASWRRGVVRAAASAARAWLRGLPALLTAIALTTLVIPASASALGEEVVSWGSNGEGQLGVGVSPPFSEVPLHVCGVGGCVHGHLNGVIAISAGAERSVALLNTHEVVDWGDNEHGALGDGNLTNSSSPVYVCAPEALAHESVSPPNCSHGVLKGVAAISAGDGRNTLALLESGEVVSWGSNVAGDLGNGQNPVAGSQFSVVPVYVCDIETGTFKTCSASERLKGAVAVSAAPDHNAAIVGASRALLTWGVNRRGQLGQGYWSNWNDDPQHVCETEYPYGQEQPENREPRCPAGHYLEGVEQITFGLEHNIATFSGRYIYRTCNEGKLREEEEEKKKGKGKGKEEEHKKCCNSEGVEKDAKGGSEGEECCKWKVGPAGEECCAGTGDGEECCKGKGDGEPCPGEEIEEEASHSVVAFGNNEEGQLGDGLAVKPFLEPQGGPAHCLKVLGKKTPCSPVPVHVCEPYPPSRPSPSPCGLGEFLEPVKAIAAGGSHSMALEGTGEVITWGEDEVPSPVSKEAILGHKTLEHCSFTARPCSAWPETVVNEKDTGNLTGITAIAGGTLHNLALTTAGEVFAWGDGQEGRLGNHGTATSLTPVKVCKVEGATGCSPSSPLKEVKAISAGNNHSLALVECKLVIEPPPFHGGTGGSTSQLRYAERGLPYNYIILAGCNLIKPLKWEVIGGSLPNGLTLGPETGAVTGTPTTDGTSHFTVQLTNGEDETASAAMSLTVVSAPDFGVCTKAAAEPTGVTFTDKGCTKRAEGEAPGKYEWSPGVEEADFTLAAKGAIKLESVTKQLVTCAGASGSGAFGGAQEVSGVLLRLSGCESRGLPCTSGELAAGEVESSTLAGVLGETGPKKAALDFAPAEAGAPFMSYECAAVPGTVTGSVLVPVKTDKMTTTTELKFSASKGRQKPEAFEEAAPDVLFSFLGEGEPAQTGLTATLELASEEGVEVNDVT
jgi:alpha-tubulin suppressor-like RCC1 family protein